jgi:hypothetical protein
VTTQTQKKTIPSSIGKGTVVFSFLLGLIGLRTVFEAIFSYFWTKPSIPVKEIPIAICVGILIMVIAAGLYRWVNKRRLV